MTYPGFTMLLGGGIFAMGLFFKLWPIGATPSIEIYDPFSSTYRIFEGRLGKPLAPAQLSKGVFQAFFDRATVIWLEHPGVLYAFPSDSQKPYLFYEDTSLPGKEWHDADKVRKILKVPNGRKTPTGELARRWSSNPKKFEWMGWPIRQCGIDASKVKIQHFEHGRIIGVFLRTFDTNGYSQNFVVFNDGSWSSQGTSAEAAKCTSEMH
jgi:hypothetical protein